MTNPFETIDARLSNIETLLLDLKHSNTTTLPESNQLLTIKQAGELISLSVPTIYGLVSRNEIPFSKKGKRLYFLKQELTSWIQEGRNKTSAEISAEVNLHLSSQTKRG